MGTKYATEVGSKWKEVREKRLKSGVRGPVFHYVGKTGIGQCTDVGVYSLRFGFIEKIQWIVSREQIQKFLLTGESMKLPKYNCKKKTMQDHTKL